jgi:hypothetical protein
MDSRRYSGPFELYYHLLDGSEALIKRGAIYPKTANELRRIALAKDDRIQRLADGRLHFFQQQTGRYGERIMVPYDRAPAEGDALEIKKALALFSHKPQAIIVMDLIGAAGSPIEEKVRYIGPAAFSANFLMVASTLSFPQSDA